MTQRLKTLITALMFTPGSIMGQDQNQADVDRRQSFDCDWKFSLEDHPAASAEGFDDTRWRNLDVPHDWSIEGTIDQKNPAGGAGGYLPAGVGWYRKTFKAPSGWHGRRISIYFEGVYTNAEVFINGKSLGVHPYGYTSFSYDLTPYLNYKKENVIAVRVDNSRQINCRWYSGSGIYRHVWLFVADPVHIGRWGVHITTPDVSPKKASVRIKTLVCNETTLSQSIVLSTRLTAGNGKSAGTNEVKVELRPKSEKEIVQTVAISSPLLWSPQTPDLYRAQTKVLQGAAILDISNNAFGIRSITFSPQNGFQLNGKTVKLNGGCVHHDNGCLGAAAYDRAEERKVALLKSAGFNAVRTAHNPPSEAFLDACDRLGLLVIDESFDGWRTGKNTDDYARFFDEWWQRDLESMMLRDRNHPSIIMWSIGNEIIERKKAEAVETAEMLAGAVRKMDPTRPVTSAMTTWDNDWEIFDPLMSAHDVCGYNYQIHRAVSDHERVPSRIIVQTESYPRDAFENWQMVQNHNYIIGDIDLLGWRKPISHYRNVLWNATEKLYLAVREPNPDNGEIKETMWTVWPTWESWTWPGYEGKDLHVEVYSKYPAVRLYINDKFIGERSTTKEQKYKATFTLPYTPGVLKAVGVDDNNEKESTVLRTAGEPAVIRLIPDRTEISADGQDLLFVGIELRDRDGNIQPNAENRLLFRVEGPGIIVGVDNANLKDLEPYVGNTRKVWHGRALVVVKSTRSAGDIRLTVSSPGLPDAGITIKAVGN